MPSCRHFDAVRQGLTYLHVRVGRRVCAFSNQLAVLQTGNHLPLHDITFLQSLGSVWPDDEFFLGNQFPNRVEQLSHWLDFRPGSMALSLQSPNVLQSIRRQRGVVELPANRLSSSKMAQEKPGQTLQATALVHEAYIKLVRSADAQQWDSRGHFFAAAAEAMRRILVEQARPQDALDRLSRIEQKLTQNSSPLESLVDCLLLKGWLRYQLENHGAAADVARPRMY